MADYSPSKSAGRARVLAVHSTRRCGPPARTGSNRAWASSRPCALRASVCGLSVDSVDSGHPALTLWTLWGPWKTIIHETGKAQTSVAGAQSPPHVYMRSHPAAALTTCRLPRPPRPRPEIICVCHVPSSILADSKLADLFADDSHVGKLMIRKCIHEAQENHGRARSHEELAGRNLHKISARRLHTQRGEGVRGLKGCMSRANG